jgi:hypothetical protein
MRPRLREPRPSIQPPNKKPEQAAGNELCNGIDHDGARPAAGRRLHVVSNQVDDQPVKQSPNDGFALRSGHRAENTSVLVGMREHVVAEGEDALLDGILAGPGGALPRCQ